VPIPDSCSAANSTLSQQGGADDFALRSR